MKVRRKYTNNGPFEASTKDLIEMGVWDSDCQIMRLQDKISNLERIVAILIDRLNLSKQDLLEITGTGYMLEIVE